MFDSRSWATAGITALALAAIGGGLILSGGPGEGRAERRDWQRSADLSAIESQIRCLARQTGTLSVAIETTDACPDTPTLDDPVTGQPYEITLIDARNVRLCASFETERAASGLQLGDSGQAGCRILRWEDNR